MNRVFHSVLLMAVVGYLASGIASADRLVTIPTGDTLTTGGIRAEVQSRFDASKGQSYWVNLGLPHIEIEGARFQDYNGRSDDSLSIQASVLPETMFSPGISLGLRDVADNTRNSNMPYQGRAAYLAVSKSIPLTGGIPLLLHDVKVHGGVGTGSLKGLFFGAEGTLPLGLRAKAEYDSSRMNFEAAYFIVPKVKVDAALIKGDMYYGGAFSTAF